MEHGQPGQDGQQGHQGHGYQEDQEQCLTFLGYFEEPTFAQPNVCQTVEDWMFYYASAFGRPNMEAYWNAINANSDDGAIEENANGLQWQWQDGSEDLGGAPIATFRNPVQLSAHHRQIYRPCEASSCTGMNSTSTIERPEQVVDNPVTWSPDSRILDNLIQRELRPMSSAHGTFVEDLMPGCGAEDTLSLRSNGNFTQEFCVGSFESSEPLQAHAGDVERISSTTLSNETAQANTLSFPRIGSGRGTRKKKHVVGPLGYCCPNCSTECTGEASLRQHLRVHSRPHPCPSCPKRFAYKKDLHRHEGTRHSAIRPLKCPLSGCKYAETGFKRKDNLKRHCETQHSREHVPPLDGPVGRSPDIESDISAETYTASAHENTAYAGRSRVDKSGHEPSGFHCG